MITSRITQIFEWFAWLVRKPVAIRVDTRSYRSGGRGIGGGSR